MEDMLLGVHGMVGDGNNSGVLNDGSNNCGMEGPQMTSGGEGKSGKLDQAGGDASSNNHGGAHGSSHGSSHGQSHGGNQGTNHGPTHGANQPNNHAGNHGSHGPGQGANMGTNHANQHGGGQGTNQGAHGSIHMSDDGKVSKNIGLGGNQGQGDGSQMMIQPSAVRPNQPGVVNELRPFMCPVCSATYKTRTHLRRHMCVHLNERPFHCDMCSKGFNRKEHLTKHRNAIHGGMKYKCEYCGKEISRQDHLNRHIKNMHGNLLNFKDMLALENFSLDKLHELQESLKVENKIKNEPAENMGMNSSENKYGVSLISNPVNNSGINLGDNRNLGNESGGKKPIGDKASANLNNSNNVNGAQNSGNATNASGLMALSFLSQGLTSDNAKPGASFAKKDPNDAALSKSFPLQLFNCPNCSAAFMNEKDLTVHARTHSKIQPYKCNQCTRAYTRREKLTEHIKCYHEGLKFTCQYCLKDLSRKDHLIRHVRSIHFEVVTHQMGSGQGTHVVRPVQKYSQSRKSGSQSQPSVSAGDFGILLRSVCKICCKVFGTSYHLQRHIASCHSGDVRPYSCQACKRNFKRKDHVLKHMKSHCPNIRDANPEKVSQWISEFYKNTKPNLKDLQAINEQVKLHKQMPAKQPLSPKKKPESKMLQAVDNQGSLMYNDGNQNTDQNLTMGDLNSLIQDSSQIAMNSENSEMINQEINKILSQQNSSDPNVNVPRKPLPCHIPAQVFPCGHCQREFTCKETLINHLQSHSGEDMNVLNQAIQDPNSYPLNRETMW